MKAEAWSLDEAQQAFAQMPRELRIESLSPAFAAADAAREAALRPLHVGVRAGEAVWLHSLHCRLLPGATDAFGAISPYGYGGPLCNSEEAAFLSAAWSAYTRWCARQAIVAEFARFHPEAANRRFWGGGVAENRATVSVDLGLPTLESQYSTLARRKLRLAGKAGVQARFSREPADWRRWGGFYRAAMLAMGAAPWYAFGDAYFDALRQLPVAWLCICENEAGWLSAGVYLFGEAVAEYHLGASAQAGRQAGSAYLMQHAAAGRARAMGARSLYLGGGTGREADNPLLFYKMGFSRRLLPFSIGQHIHDEHAYWAIAAKSGYHRGNPPPRILLD